MVTESRPWVNFNVIGRSFSSSKIHVGTVSALEALTRTVAPFLAERMLSETSSQNSSSSKKLLPPVVWPLLLVPALERKSKVAVPLEGTFTVSFRPFEPFWA